MANTLNRVALITGGTRGIGQGIAKVLATDGYYLALNGIRDEAKVKPVLEELKDLGVDVLYVQGDIGETSDREAILDGVQGYFGRLDILVNNAGVAPPSRADILEAEESSFNELMRVNCGGPFFLTQAAARWMIEQNETDAAYAGVIIFVTSISAVVASINRGDYCMSKAALSMAARLWAIRLAKHGIPVYELRPGNHRDGHDRRREGKVRPPDCRRAYPRTPLGQPRGHRPRRRRARARRVALCHRAGNRTGWRVDGEQIVISLKSQSRFGNASGNCRLSSLTHES